MYPYLREEARAPSPTSAIGVPLEHLDLATVIKVCQAVTGEIVLEKLLDTLTRTAIEHAGAERGLLIIPRGAEQRIRAEAVTSGETVIVRLCDEPVTTDTLPNSVLRYVLRTQESLILDNATAQNPFSADPYVEQHQARSILCLPLINQAKLIGVLYLENNLIARVFTPTRITVLKLLASQAAISLENSRLYGELEQREAKIRRLVDANIIGIFIWDFNGQILETNDAFLNIVGYDREDLVAGRLRWTDLTPPEWLDRYERGRAPELKMTGSLQPFEQEFFRRGGSRVPVMIGLVSFEDSGRQGVAFVLDLTERKRAEAALRASEERWRAMFETAPVGITMRDFEHRTYLTVNESFQRIIGYTEDELRHLTALDITHEDDRPATQKRIDSGVIGVLQRKRYRRKGGEVIWADVTPFVVPSTDRTSTVLGAVIVDITERTRAEEALQQAQADLARLNRVMLLGEMTASIAHEVNQPISAVITNAHAGLRWLEARRPDLEEVRQALSRVVRDGNRAGQVIDRIRALVRKVPPHRDRSNINEAIHEVIALTRTEVERNGIRLRTWLADNLPLVAADPVQLQQVIMNLIVNAIEAMAGIGDRPRELTIASGEGDAKLCSSKSEIPARGSIRRISTGCSSPSIRPSPMGSAWGWRSAARLSKRMAGRCRQHRTGLMAPLFNLRCRRGQTVHEYSSVGWNAIVRSPEPARSLALPAISVLAPIGQWTVGERMTASPITLVSSPQPALRQSNGRNGARRPVPTLQAERSISDSKAVSRCGTETFAAGSNSDDALPPSREAGGCWRLAGFIARPPASATARAAQRSPRI
jgi:PAS domain S-box-containing protein